LANKAVLFGKYQSKGIKSEHDPSYYFKNNIWITTSGNFSPLAYDSAISRFGSDRILFGSVFPYETMEESITFLDERPMTVEGRDRLFHKKCGRFFRLHRGMGTAIACST